VSGRATEGGATRELAYVADPMCSWCWGFASVLDAVRARLAPDVRLALLLGGLAPDSDEPMPEETRRYVQGAWRAVEARTGARFDWSFWERCAPRRSTWPACRAVLAAARQAADGGWGMFAAVQRAYYARARDPSDRAELVRLAGEQGLDAERFARELDSPEVVARLAADRARAAELGVRGFPTLLLVETGRDGSGPVHRIAAGFAPAAEVLERLAGLGALEN